MSGEPESTSVELAFRPKSDAQSVASFQAELAASELERRRGLSERPCMQAGWGMLFVYPEVDQVTHQTLDMRYDLDLAFLDEEQNVVDVRRGLVAGEHERVTSEVPVQYVVETVAGDLDGVSEGDIVTW